LIKLLGVNSLLTFVIAWLHAAFLHISEELLDGITSAFECLAITSVQRGVLYLRRVSWTGIIQIERMSRVLGGGFFDSDGLGMLVLCVVRLRMYFFMFLEILGTLKGFMTNVA